MRKLWRAIGATVVVSITVALSIGSVALAHPSAHAASCTYGRIGGVVKCLRRGEYCARRFERQYERYGFSCDKLDYLGRWHLEYN